MGNASSSGAQQTTSILIPSLQNLDETDEVLLSHISRDLPHHIFERKMTPTSGRFSSTYRIRHQDSGAVMLLKCVLVELDSKRLERQQIQLEKLIDIQAECHHLASYQAWSVGTTSFSVQNQNNRVYRPIYLIRPHMYSTLSNRIVTRPFLSNAEKMFISHQILNALGCLHDKGMIHGHLSCANIGLTSWNWVVLIDILPEESRPTFLAQDDPGDFIYYFQERGMGLVKDDVTPTNIADNKNNTTTVRRSSDGSTGEKRCYVAPERFVLKDNKNGSSASDQQLTASMDIFSLGCVLMELFLNGEPAMDLGDLMEYKQTGDDISKHSSLSQRLNKIESGNMRACCRHMLHLEPKKRLSCSEYLTRLSSNTGGSTKLSSRGHARKQEAPLPTCHENVYFPLFMRVRCEVLSPDARIALSAAYYGDVIRETIGVNDLVGEMFFKRVIGPSMVAEAMKERQEGSPKDISNVKADSSTDSFTTRISSKAGNELDCDELLIRTEILLREIESGYDPNAEKADEKKDKMASSAENGNTENPWRDWSTCDSARTSSGAALVIFVQFVLGTIRHTQRPSSKLVGMQLLLRVSKFSSDEIRLQRIVPTLISIASDSDAGARAMAITVLTKVISMVDHFPPSDAQAFPKYILKRIAHLINDPVLMVRLAFVEALAQLAETALRFLDTCHAQKLFENGDESFSDDELPSRDFDSAVETAHNAFDNGTDSLLENDPGNRNLTKTKHSAKKVEREEKTSRELHEASSLIRDEYDKDLRELQETFARWIVLVTTDTSEHASALKQAILTDIARLCHFFGNEGVMTCILPQILAFLNHRKDWQLRAALCQHLPAVCAVVGRAATESFVVPCVETALIDNEEMVIVNALRCLTSLVRMGLLTRAVLFGTCQSSMKKVHEKSARQRLGILEKYSALLMHPFDDIRHSISLLFAISCTSVGFPDNEVLVFPIMRPFLRHDLEIDNVIDADYIMKIVLTPIDSLATGADLDINTVVGKHALFSDELLIERLVERIRMYIEMRRNRTQTVFELKGFRGLNSARIECEQKAAFSVFVPNQKYAEIVTTPLPDWYEQLRQLACSEKLLGHELCSLRTMSVLSKVYALTILQPSHSAQPQRMWKGELLSLDLGFENSFTSENSSNESEQKHLLCNKESRVFMGAFRGEWGSASLLDPVSIEMSQIVSKLKSVGAPVVPPHLGSLRDLDGKPYSVHVQARNPSQGALPDSSRRVEWKPKLNVLSCSTSPREHDGPVTRLAVSQDQSFFVSSSHDGTCKVFEMRQIRESNGTLKSCHTLRDEGSYKVNDVTIIENSHSIASANSDGTLRIWRIDESSSQQTNTVINSAATPIPRFSRVSGSNMLRKVESKEGEISCISHFNTNSASIILFATQMGVHSWDLRCAKEPFFLQSPPEIGYVTSLAVGNDRNWLCTGTNTGK